MNHDREKRDDEHKLKLNPDAVIPYRNPNVSVDPKRHEELYGKPPEDLDGLDNQFAHLKAKIKLKVVK